MRAFKIVAAWGCVVALGLAAGHFIDRFLSREVSSIILGSFGLVAALVNAGSFQVLRRFDDPPVKNLSARGVTRLESKYERRRRAFRFKWALAVVAAIIAATCGALLKATSLVLWSSLLLRVGFGSLALALTAGVLVAVEFWSLSKLARELPKQLEEERRKRELLHRLRLDDEKAVGLSL